MAGTTAGSYPGFQNTNWIGSATAAGFRMLGGYLTEIVYYSNSISQNDANILFASRVPTFAGTVRGASSPHRPQLRQWIWLR